MYRKSKKNNIFRKTKIEKTVVYYRTEYQNQNVGNYRYFYNYQHRHKSYRSRHRKNHGSCRNRIIYQIIPIFFEVPKRKKVSFLKPKDPAYRVFLGTENRKGISRNQNSMVRAENDSELFFGILMTNKNYSKISVSVKIQIKKKLIFLPDIGYTNQFVFTIFPFFSCIGSFYNTQKTVPIPIQVNVPVPIYIFFVLLILEFLVKSNNDNTETNLSVNFFFCFYSFLFNRFRLILLFTVNKIIWKIL